MKPQWLRLAADMLEMASEEFGTHGCNDWSFPDSWTPADKEDFVKAMHENNRSPEEFDPKHLDVPDWWVMTFLANVIRSEIQG